MNQRPFTDLEYKQAQAEALRLLKELVANKKLMMGEIVDNGWARDSKRSGKPAVSSSRGWALIVALTELAAQAVDQGDRETRRVRHAVSRALTDTAVVSRVEFIERLSFE
jgi:hypothetical protein